MTFYEDLSICDYFGQPEGRLLAVGWLQREHPFRKGFVDRRVFDALTTLVANAWQPFVTAGRHPCDFCVFTGGPTKVWLGDADIPIGSSAVFVPAEAAVYVAPSLILHYVDAHQYAPPEEFQRAVELCPPMRSMEYLKALRSHGIHRLTLRA